MPKWRSVFALNTVGCLAITGFADWKRFELGMAISSTETAQ
jgi:hypothetical protein